MRLTNLSPDAEPGNQSRVVEVEGMTDDHYANLTPQFLLITQKVISSAWFLFTACLQFWSVFFFCHIVYNCFSFSLSSKTLIFMPTSHVWCIHMMVQVSNDHQHYHYHRHHYWHGHPYHHYHHHHLYHHDYHDL